MEASIFSGHLNKNLEIKIAVHILCYNVDRFLLHTVKNCYPYVDHIYLAWSPVSWRYRSRQSNPTHIHQYNLPAKYPKCQIIEGVWDTEEEMRNACLEKAREDQCDWLIIQDADEFYADSSWELAIRALAVAPASINLFKSTWFQFWKHPSIVIMNNDGQIKGTNAGFAVRIRPNSRFTFKRLTTFSGTDEESVLDVACFHFGWVLSDEEMALKIKTWGHSNEFDPETWFHLKWKRWSLGTRNLGTVNPCSWKRAVFFPGNIPDFAFDIYGSGFSIPCRSLKPKSNSAGLIAREFVYDIKSEWKWLKYWFKNSYLTQA